MPQMVLAVTTNTLNVLVAEFVIERLQNVLALMDMKAKLVPDQVVPMIAPVMVSANTSKT